MSASWGISASFLSEQEISSSEACVCSEYEPVMGPEGFVRQCTEREVAEVGFLLQVLLHEKWAPRSASLPAARDRTAGPRAGTDTSSSLEACTRHPSHTRLSHSAIFWGAVALTESPPVPHPVYRGLPPLTTPSHNIGCYTNVLTRTETILGGLPRNGWRGGVVRG